MKMNRVYNRECIEAMGGLQDKSIDMILCDLPYGVTAAEWDSVINMSDLWDSYKRLIKDDGIIVLTAIQPFTSLLVSSNLDMFKFDMVWKKPQGVDPFMAKIRPLSDKEDILIFSKGKFTYNPQLSAGTPYKVERDKTPRKLDITGSNMKHTKTVNNGTRLPKRIIEFKQQRGLHPTQKPVDLFEYLIQTFSNEGDLILDNCMGSGTTAIAAINTKRNFIGFELDRSFYKVARKRIREARKV